MTDRNVLSAWVGVGVIALKHIYEFKTITWHSLALSDTNTYVINTRIRI